jgi:FkbM family methyltransferase
MDVPGQGDEVETAMARYSKLLNAVLGRRPPAAAVADDSLIWRAIMQERSVDMIRLGPFMNIVHTDDNWYAGFPDQYKNQTIYDLAGHTCEPLPKITDIAGFLDEFDVKAQPYRYLAVVFVATFPAFCYCDIGAQYGTSAMEMARLFRSVGARPRQFAFEPGIASNLVPMNLVNNGFPEIEFHPVAIGPVDGFVVLHRELGASEDNRIVNPVRQRERGSMSFAVRCQRIDSFLRAQAAFGPALVKIDTQGAEPGVLAGMRELLGCHPVAGSIEFTPDAIRGATDPDAFVGQLLDTHYVFDQGVLDSRLQEITRSNLTGFGERVFNTPDRWVDLMLVPKAADALRGCVARLRAAQHG